MNPTTYRTGDFLTVERTHGAPLTYWVRSAGQRFNPDFLLLAATDDHDEPWDRAPRTARHATTAETERFQTEHNAWRVRRNLTSIH